MLKYGSRLPTMMLDKMSPKRYKKWLERARSTLLQELNDMRVVYDKKYEEVTDAMGKEIKELKDKNIEKNSNIDFLENKNRKLEQEYQELDKAYQGLIFIGGGHPWEKTREKVEEE